MRWIPRIFTGHLKETGETYWQHQRYAMLTSLKLIKWGMMLWIHSIFPFLYTTTASRGLIKLSDEMKERSRGSKIDDQGW